MKISNYDYAQLVRERVNLKKIAVKTAAKYKMLPTFSPWFIRVHDGGASLVLPYQLPDGRENEVSCAL